MATHKVDFQVPWRPIGREDVVFSVEQDGEKLGELKVSKGAVVWRPRHGKRSYRADWTRLDHLMRQARVGKF
jgi:hypothetical protein